MTERLSCQLCGKRLSRKTARLIDGVVMCSACMFAPRNGVVAAHSGDARFRIGEDDE